MSLGFTGGVPFTDIELRDGKGQAAIWGGLLFFVGCVVLRYLPPPQRRAEERARVAISSTQIALVSRFDEWVSFEEASIAETTDARLSKVELIKKNTELRLELATLQGILQRRVSDKGLHEVRSRYADDKTVLIT